MPRVARSAETRELAGRRKPYQPRSKLTAPTPPPGYHGRWIRVKQGAIDDVENISNREHEGYRFVTAEEAAKWAGTDKWDGTQHVSGPFQGLVGRRDLVYGVNAIENVESRIEYYDARSKRQMDEVDHNMFNAARDAPQHIAFDNPRRRTRVKTGPGAAKLQFADDAE